MDKDTGRVDLANDREGALTFVNVLEGRRAAIEQAQWQAPTLTIAAQAFLLSVLTDSDVSTTARVFILVAGVLACVAAVLGLVRLRAREIQYSEAVSDACEKARLPDPRPFEPFPRKQAPDTHKPGRVDRAVRAVGASKWLPTVYLFWIATLLAFIAADIVALVLTAERRSEGPAAN